MPRIERNGVCYVSSSYYLCSLLLLQVVIVGDDCALPPPRGLAGRRGLAGTLFVHKVGTDLLKWA